MLAAHKIKLSAGALKMQDRKMTANNINWTSYYSKKQPYRPTAVWTTKTTAACNSRHKPSRPSYVTADFEEAPVSALQQVFGTMAVAGCWFYYAQAVVKRLTEIGLRDAYWVSGESRRAENRALSAQPTGVASWWNRAGYQSHSHRDRLLMTANTWKVWRSCRVH